MSNQAEVGDDCICGASLIRCDCGDTRCPSCDATCDPQPAAHVKTTSVDDGGCQRCDECDLRPGHAEPCDCDHPSDAVVPEPVDRSAPADPFCPRCFGMLRAKGCCCLINCGDEFCTGGGIGGAAIRPAASSPSRPAPTYGPHSTGCWAQMPDNGYVCRRDPVCVTSEPSRPAPRDAEQVIAAALRTILGRPTNPAWSPALVAALSAAGYEIVRADDVKELTAAVHGVGIFAPESAWKRLRDIEQKFAAADGSA